MAKDKTKLAEVESTKADEAKGAELAAENQDAEAVKAEAVKAEAAKAEAAEKKAKAKPTKYTVASAFRDIDNFNKIHKVGDDVSSFDKERLKSLVSRDLVKKS